MVQCTTLAAAALPCAFNSLFPNTYLPKLEQKFPKFAKLVQIQNTQLQQINRVSIPKHLFWPTGSPNPNTTDLFQNQVITMAFVLEHHQLSQMRLYLLSKPDAEKFGLYEFEEQWGGRMWSVGGSVPGAVGPWYGMPYFTIMLWWGMLGIGKAWYGVVYLGPVLLDPMGKSMVLYGKVCCGMLWLWYGMAECCWTLTPTHPKTLLPNPTPTRAAAPQTLFLNVSLLLMCIISHLVIGQAFYWESVSRSNAGFGDSCPKHFPEKFDQIFILATSLIW